MTAIKQMSFAAGEIAPSLYARTDLSRYAIGLRTLRNFFVMRSGGAANRAGTSFILEAKNSAKKVRIIPLYVNSERTFVLEFGHQYIRAFLDGELFLGATSVNITGATQANPCVITANSHGLVSGDEVYISGVGGMTQLNGGYYTVTYIGANTFSLDGVNSTAYGAYTSGGTIKRSAMYTPYDETDLFQIQIQREQTPVSASYGGQWLLVHPDYDERRLYYASTGDFGTGVVAYYAQLVGATTNVATGYSTSPSAGYSYTGCAVSATGEEGEATDVTTGDASGNETVELTVASGVLEPVSYNFYASFDASTPYGYIGSSTNGYLLINNAANLYQTIDFARSPMSLTNQYELAANPSVVGSYQQRILLAYGNQVIVSRIGNTYFPIPSYVTDADAFTFKLTGQRSDVRHILDLGKLVILTAGGAFVALGNEYGAITPNAINLRQQSQYGAAVSPCPLIIGESAIYLQSRGSVIRDLAFEFSVDGYRGNDLTLFSTHLFDGYTIADWAYQEAPHSVVWMVRSDGKLLSLTYIREQQLLGWARHDTDGTFESACVVPNGTEDALYVVVKRTINGSTKRYIEKMASRTIEDIEDAIFMDCAATTDGTHTGSTTMTLSGGTNWTYDELLTLTASSGTFTAGDVGNEIHLTGSDGTVIRFEVSNYSSTTVVTGHAHMTVPSTMRSVAISSWGRAVSVVTGLSHLEAKAVSVFADGYVVGSPNNPSYTTYTVTGGQITLDRPYVVIHVGLPYLSDLETLNIDTSQGETLSDKQKLITAVTAHVDESRGFWTGAKPPTDDDTDALENLVEAQVRQDEDMDEPVSLTNDPVEVNIAGEYNNNGRVFIRNTEPVPLTILSVVPTGLVPIQR